VGEDEVKRLLGHWQKELHTAVVSQHEAITAVARAVRKGRAGIKDPEAADGSFIFAGPTGVGKTLLAKTLAKYMFGEETALIQLDMSEYQEKHNVSRLWGAPPGYVGYEEGGQLTEKIRRRPYSVVLLDEIEKAHPDVWNSLLQIMEEGRLTDSFGRVIDFKNTILIMTTNVGATQIVQGNTVGFKMASKNDSEVSYTRLKETVNGELEKVFRPEFLNRLDDTIVFRRLSNADLKWIVDLEISKLAKRLKEKNLKLDVSDEVKQLIIEKGTSLDFGARPLRRAIEQYLEDPLSEELLRGTFKDANVITTKVTEENGDKKVALEGATREAEEASPVAETAGAGK
jgi:ATP-dependent Clp protease ATP-binding subunit ClpC